MVHDPLGVLDALMIAVSGFFIVFLMLAVLWGIIVIISRAVTALAGKEQQSAAAPAAPAPAPAPAAIGRRCASKVSTRHAPASCYRQPRDRHSARRTCI